MLNAKRSFEFISDLGALHRPAEFGFHFVQDNNDILQFWKGLFDFMCYPESHSLNQLTGFFHDIIADPVDDFIVYRLMQIIVKCCAINIGFYGDINHIIVASRPLMGIIAMMGIKGHSI